MLDWNETDKHVYCWLR